VTESPEYLAAAERLIREYTEGLRCQAVGRLGIDGERGVHGGSGTGDEIRPEGCMTVFTFGPESGRSHRVTNL
jgi:hypothetical protein